MRLIDANVILRYLLNDHAEMSPKAKTVVMSGACTTVEIICEVVYVLMGVYKAEREEVHGWLVSFLDEISLENRQAVLYALRKFAETTLDFADCMLIGYNHILGQQVFTFDKKLKRMLEQE